MRDKYSRETIEDINAFKKRYADSSYRIDWDTVKYEEGNSVAHEMMKARICLELLKLGKPFATEVRFDSGYRPDIICPTHVKQIIEVRYSETDVETKDKIKRRVPRSL